MKKTSLLMIFLGVCVFCLGCTQKKTDQEKGAKTEPVKTEVWETEDPTEEPAPEDLFASLPSCEYEIQELPCSNQGKNIYGVVYKPKKAEPMPLIIFAHGYNDSYISGGDYSDVFASHGIATYCFDFCGGSIISASDGDTTEMTIMTEVSDLEAVLNTAASWDFVDPGKVVVLGSSMGGEVAAITAARNPDLLADLMLLYPAFDQPDEARYYYKSVEEIPELVENPGGMPLSKAYYETLWNYDAFSEIGAYKKPVLILHGDSDKIVDVSYARHAAEVYENATLRIYEGAGHGFGQADYNFLKSTNDMFTFLKENRIIEEATE